MTALEEYDGRIARILSKAEAIRNKRFRISVGTWPPVWKPPIPEAEAAAFEGTHGIRLPEDYRRFLTTAAGGGSQPFYGLEPLGQEDGAPARPFPYRLDRFPYFLYMTEEEMEDFDYDETENGWIPLCTEGCGMDSILVVNSGDPAVYGTVWYFDLANDFGIVPMRDKQTGRPFHFLDWLEYWVDRTAELDEDGYFGFAETVQLPPPPDNPAIMGRKMGWIS